MGAAEAVVDALDFELQDPSKTDTSFLGRHGAATQSSDKVEQNNVDWEIVQRVRRGETEAFDLLVLKYQHRLTRFISGYVGDSTEALDLAQETFIKAYRALPRFRGESGFYTWLYRIAVNTSKNYVVHRKRASLRVAGVTSEHARFEQELEPVDNATPENHLLAEQIRQTVSNALEGLPSDLKTAITLRELEGLSYEEIALAMQCPIGTVRSRIFRAREQINAQLHDLLE